MDVRTAKGKYAGLKRDLLARGRRLESGDRHLQATSENGPSGRRRIAAFVIATQCRRACRSARPLDIFRCREALTDGAARRGIARIWGAPFRNRPFREPAKIASMSSCRCGTSALTRQGVRRFPERRDGRRYPACRARRLRLDRASQALHHARHGDRSGKDRQLNGHALHGGADRKNIAGTESPSFARPPYTPVAIGAFAGHHRDRNFRPDTPDRRPPMGDRTGRDFRRDRPVDARAMVRAPGRSDWLETVSREVTMTRNGVGVCDVSTLGKIDIQGPDAGGLARPPLHQHILDLARRQGALRHDAARGRLRDGRRHHHAVRRRPLFHDHDHRQRRQGDAAHGVLPSGIVAGTRRPD